ncbi:hypothetical protein KOI40_17680 [Aestuariicella sp. G3-2]|uniref:hypothetical protein n=1 Tax=Pseudomaricurvus albidus TaxID=2842452 RepID=UPI001C0B7D64|nr:hypothetical protein [Aestuariicella albida]MBU3071663.1 hypothetical protein [Aestuariicella albida]
MLINYKEKSEDFVSIVIVASVVKAGNLFEKLASLSTFLDERFLDYEILVIEDQPRTISRAKLNNFLNKIGSIRFIELSYEVDFDLSIAIGLENSIGDFVLSFNPECDPPEAIVDMVTMCQNRDLDILVGVADNARKSIGYRLLRPLASWILKEIEYYVPSDATTLRCISRVACNAVTKAKSAEHQIFVRISQTGLAEGTYRYMYESESRRNFISSFIELIDLLIFNTVKPLRWMSMLGLIGSFSAFVFALFSFLSKLLNENVADGWSSLVIFISVLFMILFVILSFFGEYLGRLLNGQGKHNSYWIVGEYHSSVMLDTERNNVSTESTK